LGSFLTGFIKTLILAIIFVIVSIITVFGIHFKKLSPKISSKIRPAARIIVCGTFFLNLITGMRGGSGGSLFPSFLKMMKLNMREAIATSLFATIYSAAAGVIIYWYRGDIMLLPAIAVVIGSMSGARIGSLISLKTKIMWLEIGLSVLIIILALFTLYKAM
jgi:uncharacterized membrane protein YfcA